MKVQSFKTEFVEYIPEALQPGVLYVSMIYATAAHLCACGCGVEVTTPLSPTGWQLFFDGRGITLQPSIGNWSFNCRSHYFIRDSNVRWSWDMSEKQIAAGREKTKALKQKYYAGTGKQDDLHTGAVRVVAASPAPAADVPPPAQKPGWWRK